MKRLQEIMALSNVSQVELARRIGLTQPAIHSIIKAGSTNLETAILIAKELGTSLDLLCGLDDMQDKRYNKLKSRLMRIIEKA